MERFLFPRLNTSYARVLADELSKMSVESAAAMAETRAKSHTANISFAATGAPRISPTKLEGIASGIRNAAKLAGYPNQRTTQGQRSFEFEVIKLLAELPIVPAEAAREEVWQYITCVLVPDVVCWRHGKLVDGEPGGIVSRERFLGGVRNAIGRLYVRSKLLASPVEGEEFAFINPESRHSLGEDQFVALIERTALVRSPQFSLSIARAFRNHADSVPDSVDSPAQTLFREAMKLITRRLAFVSLAALSKGEIDQLVFECFDSTLSALGGSTDIIAPVDELTDVDPLPAVERHLSDELWKLFVAKHNDAVVDLEILASQVENYINWLRAQARRSTDVDVTLAEQLAESLSELVRGAEVSGANAIKSTVGAAVRYFVSGDDAIRYHERGGFEDDREIVNAVARALGRSDLVVKWAEEWTDSYGLEEIPMRLRSHFIEILNSPRTSEDHETVLRDHLAYLRLQAEATEGVNLLMAEQITRGYLELLRFLGANSLPAKYKAVLDAGIRYFALEDDANRDTDADGLTDDRDIFNAVATYLGRSDLTFKLPSGAEKGPRVMTLVKRLSSNDVGETGSNQAGMFVPKQEEVLSLLPPLSQSTKNPDVLISAIGPDGETWGIRLVYYNSKYFDGTRDEYRLTRLSSFFNHYELKAGDALIIRRVDSTIELDFVREEDIGADLEDASWKVVETT